MVPDTVTGNNQDLIYLEAYLDWKGKKRELAIALSTGLTDTDIRRRLTPMTDCRSESLSGFLRRLANGDEW